MLGPWRLWPNGRPSQVLLIICLIIPKIFVVYDFNTLLSYNNSQIPFLTFFLCPKNTSISFETTRRPASADKTARCQFQAVFPVITGSFPTNVIAHLHGLSMNLTVGRTVGPTVDSTDGWTVGLTVKLCKHWFDSRSNYWSNCGNHWPTSEPNAA